MESPGCDVSTFTLTCCCCGNATADAGDAADAGDGNGGDDCTSITVIEVSLLPCVVSTSGSGVFGSCTASPLAGLLEETGVIYVGRGSPTEG